MICSDFFAVRVIEFLIVVDRYSNYPIMYKAPSLSSSGVVTVLRSIFMTYGVPERITTDEGMCTPAMRWASSSRTGEWNATRQLPTTHTPTCKPRGQWGH